MMAVTENANKMLAYDQKHVIITGGSSGIGKASRSTQSMTLVELNH
jgi:NADP-dependent 3-hydroxy acid dehydrogenase YdfG